MSLHFRMPSNDACFLCGSTERLSGEHKIKASLLKREFQGEKMLIGRFEEGFKSAQGPKSKAMHFKSRMCEECNGTRTQSADREFDRFHDLVADCFASNRPISSIFDLERYSVGRPAYLNVFRYFAKLLCCQIVDAGGPSPLEVANFAIGEMHHNCIGLSIGLDAYYQEVSAEFGKLKHAAHGGLIVYGDTDEHRLTAFHSTLTIGSIQYVFHARFHREIAIELEKIAPEFYAQCMAAVHSHEMSSADRSKLGLPNHDLN